MAKRAYSSVQSRGSRTRAWSDFKRWCDTKGLKALPAHAWTISAYLRWVDRRADAQAAHAALDAISREHLLKTARVPARHPTVQNTLALIDRRAEVRPQQAALFDEADALADFQADDVPAPGKAAKAVEENDGGDDTPARVRRMLSTQPKLKRARRGAKNPAGKKK